MSWKDSQQFEKWLSSLEANAESEDIELLRKAYEAGYRDGFKAGKYYDPVWDAD